MHSTVSQSGHERATNMMMEQAMKVAPPPAPRGGLTTSSASATPHMLLLPDYLGAASAAFDGQGEGCGNLSHGPGLCLGCGTVHASVREMVSKLWCERYPGGACAVFSEWVNCWCNALVFWKNDMLIPESNRLKIRNEIHLRKHSVYQKHSEILTN